MATLQSDQVANNKPPRLEHAGGTWVLARYTSTASLSAGDVIQMIPIQHGMTIIDWILWTDTTDGSATFGIGDGSSTARFGSATASTVATALRATGTGLPYKVSVSDDALLRYDTLDLYINAVASSTAGNIFNMAVLLLFDT